MYPQYCVSAFDWCAIRMFICSIAVKANVIFTQVLTCTCCDGICGPQTGCNCQPCQRLDAEEAEKQHEKVSLLSSQAILDSWTWGPQPCKHALHQFFQCSIFDVEVCYWVVIEWKWKGRFSWVRLIQFDNGVAFLYAQIRKRVTSKVVNRNNWWVNLVTFFLDITQDVEALLITFKIVLKF